MTPRTAERRFDDADADAGYAYRGVSLTVVLAGRRAEARIYDDEPGHAAIVLDPPRGLAAVLLGLTGALRWRRSILGPEGDWRAVPWGDPLLARLLAALSVRDGIDRVTFLERSGRRTLAERPAATYDGADAPP